jgi:hypothetical protein
MLTDPNDRRNPLEHDILVARRHRNSHQFFKVEAERELGAYGELTERAQYTGVREQRPWDPGFRAIIGFACPETQSRGGDLSQELRGPALATVPLHPDPTASASCACYLFNPENVTYETAWTTEEWSDQQLQATDREIKTSDDFELLIAVPDGKVYLVSKKVGEKLPTSKEVPVKDEPELWSALRGGTVAGSVMLLSMEGCPKVVPVVNVEALMPSKLPGDKNAGEE